MSTTLPPPGVLYLVPTPLDFGCEPEHQRPLPDVLPESTLRVAASLCHWVTENAKSTRAFLKRVSHTHTLARPIQEQQIQELPRLLHKKGDQAARGLPVDALKPLLAPLLAGHSVGLVSEAGMPAVADPGARVVRLAHRMGLRVEPMVGPSSLLLALAASGMNGQRFAFHGYLPQTPAERVKAITQLEQQATQHGETQLFIETPFRNQALLTSLIQTLKPQTWLAVSAGLTLAHPNRDTLPLQTFSAPISRWRQSPPRVDHQLPAVYAIQD